MVENALNGNYGRLGISFKKEKIILIDQIENKVGPYGTFVPRGKNAREGFVIMLFLQLSVAL